MPPPANWWQRNWKWVVPGGCLGVIVIGIGSFALFIVLIFGALRNAEVTEAAVARAEESAEVRERTGVPLQAGFLVSGNISISGGGGEADLAIPVSGPHGRGTLYANAERIAGQWKFVLLIFTDSEGESINLLDHEE